LRDNGAGQDTIISIFWDHIGRTQITDDNMRVAICRAVVKLGLENNGILAARVGSHSFWAGGAMALKLVGVDRDNIKNMGRWSSDTFLL